MGYNHLLFLFVAICAISTSFASLTKYAKHEDKQVVTYSLGQSMRVTPPECSQLCDANQLCLGFNYYKSRERCEMVSQNINTVPSMSKIKENSDVDHYSKLDVEFHCPAGTFQHPYKNRCYTVVNTPKPYYDAIKHCNQQDSQLALIPNKLTKHAIWSHIADRLESNSAWLGIQFQKKQSYLKRAGQQAFFMWFSNLLKGKPEDNKSYCGAVMKDSGKFDYFSCKTSRAFVCETRFHNDVELNELCPGDTALFNGNCYWSEERAFLPTAAHAQCADRGGQLAIFSSKGSVNFIGNVWANVIPEQVAESWIGLNFENNNWTWLDGNTDADNSHWASNGEMQEGNTQSCGAAVLAETGEMKFVSRNCDEQHSVLCMGPSGVVMSRDCATKECPRNSICNEGPFEASCVCLPGYVSIIEKGKLSCRASAVCKASGDPHYYPWDGGKIDYQGLCEHLLAGTCPENPPNGLAKWMVSVYNSHREGFSDRVSFTEYTTIKVYDNTIRMGIDGVVILNSQKRIPEFVVYPFDDDKYIEVIITNGGYKLRTDFGLEVSYKNYRVTVEAPDDYANTTCGICGNWNGSPDDDLATDPAKWMNPKDKIRGECAATLPPVCEPLQREKVERICGKIHTLPFLENCRERNPEELEEFYEACVEDACEGDMKKAFCDTIESLVEVCMNGGSKIPPSFRMAAECQLQCPPNSHYEPQTSLDSATCQNPDALYEVSQGIGENCVCNDGYVREGLLCKKEEKCGCSWNGRYLEVGEEWINEDCTIKVTCSDEQKLCIEQVKCAENAKCMWDNKRRTYDCFCELGFEGDPWGDICEILTTIGDPHFMFTSKNGDLLCFDAHGYKNDVWRLINDRTTGLVVNAELFESNSSTIQHPLSFYSRIVVKYDSIVAEFTRNEINYNGLHQWGDEINGLHKVNQNTYDFFVKQGVSFRLVRAKNDDAGFYLGFFINQNSGLSDKSTGIIGQFMHTDFTVKKSAKPGQATLMFDDFHPSIQTKSIKKYSVAHAKPVKCWFYDVIIGDSQLLGQVTSYKLRNIMES